MTQSVSGFKQTLHGQQHVDFVAARLRRVIFFSGYPPNVSLLNDLPASDDASIMALCKGIAKLSGDRKKPYAISVRRASGKRVRVYYENYVGAIVGLSIEKNSPRGARANAKNARSDEEIRTENLKTHGNTCTMERNIKSE